MDFESAQSVSSLYFQFLEGSSGLSTVKAPARPKRTRLGWRNGKEYDVIL